VLVNNGKENSRVDHKGSGITVFWGSFCSLFVLLNYKPLQSVWQSVKSHNSKLLD